MGFSRKRIYQIATIMALTACTPEINYQNYNEYPEAPEANLWTEYTPEKTTFKLWSPVAKAVYVTLYEAGNGGEALDKIQMNKSENGVWTLEVKKDLNGIYYTFQVNVNGIFLDETPGIYATAVGVNGKRAMVLNLNSTNPEGWEQDKGPEVKFQNEAIIYEAHIRDITQHENSGSSYRGKFLGMVEKGTKSMEGLSTGLDHILELGVTHVHLLPSFDFFTIDEKKLDQPQFNWGYDPQNYNVPEGSYSSDPFHAEVRIKEFKKMVKGFHDNGVGVILDVVYNHTGRTEDSNFNLEVPGYYYRQTEDGNWSNASGCGNETASERAMVRKYIIESCKFWAREYHLDGFRFDLMAIHDVETMNMLSEELKKINPNIIIYGEGWTAGASPLPDDLKALKGNTINLKAVAAFSDDIRDGIKGSVFEDRSRGFVSGAENNEETIKFGVIASTNHKQIDLDKVNYSNAFWANEPWQTVNYVSCHDNHTLFDKLKISVEGASLEELKRMNKLADGIVLTSQGIAFIHAGAELLRTKNGEHNSYNLPDEINQINWTWKAEHKDVFDYYKGIIALRKSHPAFRMPSTEMLNEHLEFVHSESGLVGFKVKDHANGDSWKNILVFYNARNNPAKIELEGEWKIAVLGDVIDPNGKNKVKTSIDVPAISMMILFQ
jgi:pullulanase